MSNFISEYKKGQAGLNKGLPMGEGFVNLSKAINGVQKQRIYVVAGAPKSGKSTMVNHAFLVEPYLYAKEHNIHVEWIYFSFEIDRISMEFDMAALFLSKDFGITEVLLPDGVLRNGKASMPLTPDYLKGSVMDDNGNFIKVNEFIEEKLKIVYRERIVDLFGEYSNTGTKIKDGYITFIDEKDNPTGLYKFLMNHASKNGEFIRSESEFNNRITGYKPNNPDKYTIVILDHRLMWLYRVTYIE